MKFTIDQIDIERLLTTVTRASEQRSVLPVLANVLLVAEPEYLYAVGSNIELTIQSKAPCQTHQEGSITLPARELLSLVSPLDKNRQIEFDLDEPTNTMRIRSGKSKYNLKGIDAEDFPKVKTYPNSIEFLLPREQLVKGLGCTLYACNPKAHNELLRGLSLIFESGECRFYAGDGFRVAQYTIELPDLDMGDDQIEVITPMRSLIEVRNVFSREKSDTVRIIIDMDENNDNRMIHFDADGVVVSSQVIAGAIARNLREFFPEASTTVRVSSDQLRTALRSLSIFASDSNYSCDMNFHSEGILSLTAQSQERGNGEEEIDCEFEGEPFASIYNLKYLLDALDSFETETVLLKGRNMGVARALCVESDIQPNLIGAMSPMTRNR